ncbi:MAG: hypothetical protein K2W96_13365 [Gemmataceae bacterium]|nr:hypothetical protein [Gemmataceae bacterium]
MLWVLLAVVAAIIVATIILSQKGEALATDSPARLPAPAGMSAEEALSRVEALDKANAQWPAIWAQLNPDDDPNVQRLLADFRGPYMFAPHVALGVLRAGCERALAASPSASRVEAIQEAMKADDQIVRPH